MFQALLQAFTKIDHGPQHFVARQEIAQHAVRLLGQERRMTDQEPVGVMRGTAPCGLATRKLTAYRPHDAARVVAQNVHADS